MSFWKISPYRRRNDLEAVSNVADGGDDFEDLSDPFDIPRRTKNAPVERLKRWRQQALVLNASRRFRYTLDLKKEEEKQQIIRKIRNHAQAIRAAYLFKEAGRSESGTLALAAPGGDFPIGTEQLTSISRDHKSDLLQECGGVKGLADLLKSNVEKGIEGDDADLIKRRNAFGSNNYPRKKGRNFLLFVWDACNDLTLIILMIAAVVLLALGIKSEGSKDGWVDGGSIAFAVILVIVVTVYLIFKFKVSYEQVIRNGRRVKISIYDIAVGDVVPLNIGDQVPADGILITGHSLEIDESSMTGESKIVHKDSKYPFLMSGCKVADGTGTMLVTAVGINTEWGLLMGSTSEDNGEETPLQVTIVVVAVLEGLPLAVTLM
ncbi:calcium-transporting ATPase 10, plasma membrane-type-like isoform X1 [Senna tora]|uniref:Calcium-transporting ATPase 10, plasma membrane-type-like isoform X1 n=1 Tax=Senna tora TaxID=362788 RepID=A0A834SLI7_9FABA|nr:calcium-transporting ATPase 10, plasma membrane-type-like isoform X1 [Senna tora]